MVRLLEEDNYASVLPVNSEGVAGTIPEPVVNNFNGMTLLLGMYLQDQWHPLEKLELHDRRALRRHGLLQLADSVQSETGSGLQINLD